MKLMTLLLALSITVAPTVGRASGGEVQQRCRPASVRLYGEDGKHGEQIDYNLLQSEIAYLDGLIKPLSQQAGLEKYRLEKLRATTKTSFYVVGELELENSLDYHQSLLGAYEASRTNLSLELKRVAKEMVDDQAFLKELRCPPLRMVEESEPESEYESAACRSLRRARYGTDGRHGVALSERLAEDDLYAAQRAERFVQQVVTEYITAARQFEANTRLEAFEKTGYPPSDYQKYSTEFRRLLLAAEKTREAREGLVTKLKEQMKTLEASISEACASRSKSTVAPSPAANSGAPQWAGTWIATKANQTGALKQVSNPWLGNTLVISGQNGQSLKATLEERYGDCFGCHPLWRSEITCTRFHTNPAGSDFGGLDYQADCTGTTRYFGPNLPTEGVIYGDEGKRPFSFVMYKNSNSSLHDFEFQYRRAK